MNKNVSQLSPEVQAIVLGSLLGDGSLKIHKSYKNARFSFRHSIHQKAYFFWKTKKLGEISTEKCWWKQESNNDKEWGKKKLRFQSRALPCLTKIHFLTHTEGKKAINSKWLKKLTPLSLLVWWLDDGSIISNGRKGIFCTDGFSVDHVKTLMMYLKKNWGITTSIIKVRKKSKEYPRLCFFSTKQLKKFLKIISPELEVESKITKILLLYKDLNYQQRWISEIVSKTSFSKKVVVKHLKNKKKKWKAFRE